MSTQTGIYFSMTYDPKTLIVGGARFCPGSVPHRVGRKGLIQWHPERAPRLVTPSGTTYTLTELEAIVKTLRAKMGQG